MSKKLRLLLNTDCPRNCFGCCNKDWELERLPVCHDYSDYDKILLTGGEPMLYPTRILTVIKQIRTVNQKAKIILYTAMPSDLDLVMHYLDGITVTLHTQSDLQPFVKFENSIPKALVQQKSLRLNVFEEVGEIPKLFLRHKWNIKEHIQWQEHCPLPKDEVFMQWSGISL